MGTQQVSEFTQGLSEFLGWRLPFGETVGADFDDGQRLGLQRLLGVENSDFGAIDEIHVIRIHHESHAGLRCAVLVG